MDSFYQLVVVTVLKVLHQALSMAREGERFSGLQQSTNGIMFMGTPHHGADGAKLASTAINIANSLIDLKKYQVKMLERGSEQLQEISRTFGHFQDLKIVNVIESDETKIPCLGKHYLVGKDSSYLRFGSRLYLRILLASTLEIVRISSSLQGLITTWFASLGVRMTGITP